MSATVKQVGTTFHAVGTDAHHGEEHAHQDRGPIHHRRIDHLTLARLLCLQHGANKSVGEHHAAAAEVTYQIEGRNRLATLLTNTVQGAYQRNVIDVMTRGLCHRALLAPASHAAVNKLLVPSHAVVRTETQSFSHTRPEALKDRISRLTQFQDRFFAGIALEVDRNGLATSGQDVNGPPRRTASAVDANHFSPHVCEQHAAKRARADAGQFDDFRSGKGSHGSILLKANEQYLGIFPLGRANSPELMRKTAMSQGIEQP